MVDVVREWLSGELGSATYEDQQDIEDVKPFRDPPFVVFLALVQVRLPDTSGRAHFFVLGIGSILIFVVPDGFACANIKIGFSCERYALPCCLCSTDGDPKPRRLRLPRTRLGSWPGIGSSQFTA